MLPAFAYYAHHATLPACREVINVLQAAIIIYLSRGYTEDKTARCLHISSDTVHKHINRLYETTQLPRHNHTALISWAHDMGLIAAARAHIKGGKFFEYKMSEDADTAAGEITFVNFTS